jgi:chromosome segregation ATPase
MAPKLKSLSITGFRAYGAAGQTLGILSDISVIWGPNSKGKTSFAEACEFLLTGKTVRRELMASSQDEFADALRNAHLPLADQAYVSGAIIADDKKCHEIKRLLTSDYSKKQDCASRLEIDGSPATEADLAKLGIVLSQPPLQAPVLAQHTLSYIFSVQPQDRATYFKSLLAVIRAVDGSGPPQPSRPLYP